MRVLVVDQDSTLLTAISQTLGEYFTIDGVTTKADCLDLVRLNDFEVIVAGERLADGSGLELLGSLARSRPDMLRIFAAERERLKLLKGRLGPFGLFRTLSYPIEPRQLLAALSAAAGIEDFEERLQAQEAAAAAESPAPVSERTQPQSAPASAPSHAQATTASRPQASVASAAPAPSRAPAQQPRTAGPARSGSPAPSFRQVPRQPTPAALAAASKLDIVTRPKGFPPPIEGSAARSGFLVGAGVILVLGGLVLSFKIFNTRDEPVTLPTNTSALRAKHFPPEVVKLVSDTEVAFQQDDFKTARTDVAALQQIAPDHPRLPFFESLLKRLQATHSSKSPRSPSATAASSTPTVSATSRASRTPSSTSSAQSSDTQRRQPDTVRDAAAAAVSTFSGRILEESTTGAQTQNLATPSQAMVTPVPRRPGSAGAPSDTQPPRLIQHVAADYPPEAARKGVEGSVDVSFTISPQGKVDDVTIVNAVPSDIFNRAAITAVRRWKYEPKTVNGVPVEAHQQLRLQFKLDRRG
jgi:TonB family protein